ncbi:hypothetical protein RND81_03G004000 [Saponaria officinalis]|uniref:Uncharacterized protein n=1 Tax=Saponaria officinalis TaxID=3572 RepID=A0AAW1M499_SAPOF
MKMSIYSLFHLILLLSIIHPSLSESNVVKKLPGYPGDLPFTLETGYVGVGEKEEVKLFYYLIESERDVEKDPLVLSLTGGPGWSGLYGLFLEIGPLALNLTSRKTELDTHRLQYNPYSWTKVASIIFLDSPVGTGFSYATTPEAYYTSDTLEAARIYDFLRKWLIKHPKFIDNDLYIGGESYTGMVIPAVVQDILQGNEIELRPTLNLKGYVLGNPISEYDKCESSRYKFANDMSFLPDELYKSAEISCNSDFKNFDVKNTKCSSYVESMKQDISSIQESHVLEHNCFYMSLKSSKKQKHLNIKSILANAELCRFQHYPFIDSWADDELVQKALHIHEGSIGHWRLSNSSLAYEHDIENTFEYHLNNSRHSLQVLIYNGDQDLIVPYMSTLEWIKQLQIPVSEEWRPWFVDGQVAGYFTEFTRSPYRLVHTTIKGGGHTAPEYKPQESFAMIDRWLSMSSL